MCSLDGQCYRGASFQGFAYAFCQGIECFEGVDEATSSLGACAQDDAAVREVVHSVSASEHGALARYGGV